MTSWRKWLTHTRTSGGFRIIQITGGARWSLAIYIKPKESRP